MAPPYARSYDYFRWEAEQEIRNNRPGWSRADEKHTISTVWAGSAIVRAHYATYRAKNQAVGPGLPTPNPIPALPYNQNDANHAKATGQLPAPPVAPGPLPGVVGGAPPGAGGHAPVEGAPTQDVEGQEARAVDQMPYNYWPQMPWPDEPDLPTIDAETLKGNEVARHAWLDRDTHMPDADESTWHGTKTLGVGGFGAAGLWLQTDAMNNVIDRMVIKETLKVSAHAWRDPKNWRDRLPREIRIHQLIEERRAVDPVLDIHLIRMRNYRLLMMQRKYRIYLDFCVGGDLWHAMHALDANWAEQEDVRNPEMILPQGYIWYVIKALVSACLVLQNGTMAKERVADWKPITHLDLHPGNVLLDIRPPRNAAGDEAATGASGSKGKGKQPAIPEDASKVVPPVVPVLTDFGISFFSPENLGCPLSDNPEDYLWDRPQVAYPPETHPQNGPDLIRLGEKTDVWGIGRIAWTLLVNRLEPGCPVRDKRGKGKDLEGKDMKEYDAFIPLSLDLKVNKTIHNEKTVLTGGSAFPAVGEYTDPTLMNLVRSCLNYNPESRPTLRQIYGAAQDSLQNADEDEDFNKWAYYELMDKDGLNLKLPSHGEFEVGQNFDLASYRMRHEST